MQFRNLKWMGHLIRLRNMIWIDPHVSQGAPYKSFSPALLPPLDIQ